MKYEPTIEILRDAGIRVANPRPSPEGWISCHCPLASKLHAKGTDHSASFHLKIKRGERAGWHCFSCKEHGNLHGLLLTLGHPALAAKSILAEMDDMQVADFDDAPKKKTQKLEEYVQFRMFPSVLDFEQGTDYCVGRGVSIDTIEKLQLRYDPDHKCVMFPVRDRKGQLLGFSGRFAGAVRGFTRTHKDYYYTKSHCLLGIHFADREKPFLVVEGLFAYAHLMEIGADEFCNPVATLGSHVSQQQADIFADFDTPVYMLYDLDTAGDIGLYGTATKPGGAVKLLQQENQVRIGQYPRLCDVDDLTRDEIQKIIESDFLTCK